MSGRIAIRTAAAAAMAAAGLAAPGSGAPGRIPPTLPSETGTIYSVAGAGLFTHGEVTERPRPREGGPASSEPIDFPLGVSANPGGGYLVADTYGNRIRSVSAAGLIRTIAGTGREGVSGDGGPARAARLDHPSGAVLLPDGSVAIADQRNQRVRVIDPSGVIRTLIAARSPDGVAAAPDGGVLVVEGLENRVLHVSLAGAVTVVAGDGTRGFAGDGGPATAARLSRPRGVAVAPDGSLLIADGSNRVRRVGPDGIISTIAGNGSPTPSGDGGPAVDAGVRAPAGVAAAPDGGVLIATGNQVRRVRPDGVIVTIAGTGRGNFSGDGGPALAASLWRPSGVAAAAGGGVLVADAQVGRIRWIASANPGPATTPSPPRVFAIAFLRPIQRGSSGIVTRIRVACPPRTVALRYTLSRRADVSLTVTAARSRSTASRTRVPPGRHTIRVPVHETGFHRVVIRARTLGRIAVDQAQIDVAGCPGR